MTAVNTEHDTTIAARLAALESRVTELADGQALRALLSQYAIGVDDKRPALLRSLFTHDARVQIPAWQVDVVGLEEIMAFYERYWARFDQPRRYYANDDTRIRGDRAHTFMYWHVTQEERGVPVIGWGTYDWNFLRVDGRWLIDCVLISIRAMTTLEAGWGGAARFTDA